MRVLVTGGAGFIGGHLVDRLRGDGIDVVVLDDLSSGTSERVPADIELVQADVADPATIGRIAALRPDAVIHAAAQVSVPASVDDPDRDRAVNLVGTANVIDGATRAGAKRLVFVSSGGAIYGETSGAEETDQPAPKSPYGEHKLAAEALIRGARGSAIARLANVYGPGQRSDQDGGVVAVFCEAFGGPGPVTIHGDGEQRRDFVYVDDVVDGLVTMVRSELSGTWNVGTGRSTTISTLVSALAARLGPPAGIHHLPARKGDVRESRLRIERIVADLGWTPRFDLDAGLDRLLENVADIDAGRSGNNKAPTVAV